MADYSELHTLGQDQTLLARVQVAVLVAAQAIAANAGTETSERKAWAQRALQEPRVWAQRALWLALAANRASTVDQIRSAPDEGAGSLQSAVNDVVELMSAGLTPGQS